MDGPVLTGILSGDDGAEPMTGREVRRLNVAAGRAVGELVRTTLGPNGMDKLLVDDTGMGIVTNSGATILREQVDHPVGGIVADVALSQERTVGDGTTTAAVVAGELLGRAETLVNRGVHPTTIARGYQTANARVRERLSELSVEVDPDDERLRAVARTAMNGKGTGNVDEQLTDLVVDAAGIVGDGAGLDEDDIKVLKLTGGAAADSHLLRGVVVAKERAHPEMPYLVEDANVTVLDQDLEVESPRSDRTVTFAGPDDVDRFVEATSDDRTALVDRLCDLEVDTLVCTGAVDQQLRGSLAAAGLYAVQRVDHDELRTVARATGAAVVSDPRSIEPADLGGAGLVAEREVDGERRTSFEDVDAADAVTLVLRGTNMNLLDEHHRAIENAVAGVRSALEDGRVVPGGGAVEVELSLGLREAAAARGARESLAIEAFADALETVPRTLVENAGANSIDGLVALRNAHDGGNEHAGVDARTGDVVDAVEAGVLEPVGAKREAIGHATEAAVTVLRIDGVIPASTNIEEKTYDGPMD